MTESTKSARARVHTSRNFDGNFEDEHGGRWYVVDRNDDHIAGPFGTGSYALTVRDRMINQAYKEPLDVEYEIRDS